MTPETDIGREVRANVARILKRFEGCDIAAIKVSDLRKIDAVLNPEPDTFRIPTERTDAKTYEAMSNARIDRMLDADARIAGDMGMR